MKEKRVVTVAKERFSYSGKISLLAASACPGIFPAEVVEENGILRIYYDTRGWRQLNDWNTLSAVDVLVMVKAVLQNIETLKTWLFFPEEYILSGQTAYFSPDGSLARFLYIPDGQAVSGMCRMECFLHGMKEKTTENGIMYLETLRNFLNIDLLDTGRTLAFLDSLLTEARICGIT